MYPLRDKKRIARRKNIIKNFILLGVFLILSITGVLIWSGKIWNSIGQVVWKADNLAINTINNSGYVLRTKASVFNENESLKKENSDLRSSMIDYQIIKKENDDLKELLGRIPPKYNFTLSNILTKPNRSPYDTIIIDVGSSSGFVGGEKVFANVNIPIGEISKVYQNDSLVMLYSNPGQTTEAILDGSNASVELVGRGGGNFEMTIPNDLSSDNGTMVTLPSANHEAIAIIDGVISKPTDPVKKVILHSPVNIQSLKWVQVKRD